jgi:hypothetical protein
MSNITNPLTSSSVPSLGGGNTAKPYDARAGDVNMYASALNDVNSTQHSVVVSQVGALLANKPISNYTKNKIQCDVCHRWMKPTTLPKHTTKYHKDNALPNTLDSETITTQTIKTKDTCKPISDYKKNKTQCTICHRWMKPATIPKHTAKYHSQLPSITITTITEDPPSPIEQPCLSPLSSLCSTTPSHEQEQIDELFTIITNMQEKIDTMKEDCISDYYISDYTSDASYDSTESETPSEISIAESLENVRNEILELEAQDLEYERQLQELYNTPTTQHTPPGDDFPCFYYKRFDEKIQEPYTDYTEDTYSHYIQSHKKTRPERYLTATRDILNTRPPPLETTYL